MKTFCSKIMIGLSAMTMKNFYGALIRFFIFAFPWKPANLIPLFFRIDMKISYFPGFALRKILMSSMKRDKSMKVYI